MNIWITKQLLLFFGPIVVRLEPQPISTRGSSRVWPAMHNKQVERKTEIARVAMRASHKSQPPPPTTKIVNTPDRSLSSPFFLGRALKHAFFQKREEQKEHFFFLVTTA
mmetsp:Transcript_24047/g.33786  ORF Transcript_24047/g.33786 Transcript_24047/m.33786 type:complete len:109 (-) Transcript_24047:4363-4689(-)